MLPLPRRRRTHDVVSVAAEATRRRAEVAVGRRLARALMGAAGGRGVAGLGTGSGRPCEATAEKGSTPERFRNCLLKQPSMVPTPSEVARRFGSCQAPEQAARR